MDVYMSEFLFFSVIIPTYNRPDLLRQCLQALIQQDYACDRFEVIVVDDGSPRSLEPVLTPFYPLLNLRLITQVNSGPASARNTGSAHANGQFLVFTDDDCRPTTTWLKRLEQHLTSSPDCLIGGATLNALAHNPYSTASQLLIDFIYEYYNFNPPQATFVASNNMALPAAQFRAFQGFDTRYAYAAGEDREFCDRWLVKGHPMIFVADVQIYHAHYLTLTSFWKQHFYYGRGAFCFRYGRAKRSQSHLKFESLAFYTKLISYPLLRPTSQPVMAMVLLLFLAQVANGVGFFWEAGLQALGRSLVKPPNKVHSIK